MWVNRGNTRLDPGFLLVTAPVTIVCRVLNTWVYICKPFRAKSVSADLRDSFGRSLLLSHLVPSAVPGTEDTLSSENWYGSCFCGIYSLMGKRQSKIIKVHVLHKLRWVVKERHRSLWEHGERDLSWEFREDSCWAGVWWASQADGPARSQSHGARKPNTCEALQESPVWLLPRKWSVVLGEMTPRAWFYAKPFKSSHGHRSVSLEQWKSAWAAITKHPRLGGLNNGYLFSNSSGSWEFKIKVLAGLVLLGSLSLAGRWPPAHRVPPTTVSLCVHHILGASSSYEMLWIKSKCPPRFVCWSLDP